jgi:hypothetical protein
VWINGMRLRRAQANLRGGRGASGAGEVSLPRSNWHSFDQLVGAAGQGQRNSHAKRLGRLKVDVQLANIVGRDGSRPRRVSPRSQIFVRRDGLTGAALLAPPTLREGGDG